MDNLNGTGRRYNQDGIYKPVLRVYAKSNGNGQRVIEGPGVGWNYQVICGDDADPALMHKLCVAASADVKLDDSLIGGKRVQVDLGGKVVACMVEAQTFYDIPK